MAMKKMVLVPLAKFQAMTENNSVGNSSSSSILSDVKNPIQEEMKRKYEEAQRIINNNSSSSARGAEERVGDYVDAMHQFKVQRDKLLRKDDFHDPSHPSQSSSSTGGEEKFDVIGKIPNSLRTSAGNLLDRLRQMKDVIRWDSRGIVTIRGKRMEDTKISDLVSDVTRNTKSQHPHRRLFLDILKEHQVPPTYIKNKSARNIYMGGPESLDSRPPGLPHPPTFSPARAANSNKLKKKRKSITKSNQSSSINWYDGIE